MKITKTIAALATAASIFTTTTAMAADATRSVSALPRVAGVAPVMTGLRASKRTAAQNNLLAGPLFIAFLGAVAVTISTIVIVNNNNDSPG